MIHCPACRSSLPDYSKFCSSCGSVVATVAVTDPPVPGPRPSELQQRLSQALSGRYRVGKLLGQGGMGAVFLADDLELDRKVAIKVLPATESNDSTFVERFRREARTAAKLDHPNIIPIYRVESTGNLHFFVMRFVPGRTLDDVLADEPKLEIDRARIILIQAAKALGHAHQRDIVHRDVKPANIMLDDRQGVVLTDFGISKAVQATTHLTSTGMIIGTPSYMAPEQGRGQRVDGRADQYALGIVGYLMLTGALPFDADDVFALMFKHMSEPPPPIATRRPDLPAGFARAIGRSLAKDPADRFPTMEDFARALEPTGPIVAPTEPMARPTERRPSAPPARSKRWPWVVAAAAVGVGLAAILIQGRRAETAGLAAAALSAVAPTAPAIRSLAPPPPPASTPATPADGPPPGRESPSRSVAPPPPPPPPPPPSGPGVRVDRATVTIGVDGSYATVYIDNELIGETPVVRELSFGDHDLRIEREGFKTIRQRLVVGGPTTRRFTLEPVGPP